MSVYATTGPGFESKLVTISLFFWKIGFELRNPFRVIAIGG